MKKIVVGMLACAEMVVTSTVAFAVTGKINTDTVRLRSEASSSSSIIDLLSIDDKVEVIELEGEWYKIKANNKTGYVSKNLLNVDEEVKNKEDNSANVTKEEENTEPTEETPVVTEDQNTEQEQETPKDNIEFTESYTGKLASEVTIKILPSINSMDIAKIDQNTEFTVLEIINDWCHIETSTYSGWARTSIVKEAIATAENSEEANKIEEASEDTMETSEKEEANNKETTQNKKGYVNAEKVNVRKDKNTSSEKVTSITKNTEVTILDEEDGWYKIKVNNVTGYIMKKYISDKKVEDVTSRASDTARQILDTKTEEKTESTTPTASSGTGASVVAFAKQYLGYRYVSGGASPSTGFDCSGFTSYVYKNFGVSLNRTSSGQRSNGVAVDKSNLQAGDILCFNGHVGLYIGNNQFIHASNPSGGVKINSLSDSYYVKNYITARRVIN